MTELVKTTIENKSWARWAVLAIVSFTMMAGYVVAKEMSPLQYMLELPGSQGGMGWTSSEFGLFAGNRGFFNVFLLMLIFSGIILDVKGVRFTGNLSCAIMLGGAGITYWAITHVDPAQSTGFGGQALYAFTHSHRLQALLATLGFAVFGVGYEMCGITVSKVIVRWFSGKEMALAMGLQVAMARLGTSLALSGSLPLALRFGLSTPLLIGVFGLGLGLIAYLVYCSMDRGLDKSAAHREDADVVNDEAFHLRDIPAVLTNTGFWLITLICLFYYSALYPFLDFASKMMIVKYGIDPAWAGSVSSILTYSSIVLTPLFGAWCDRRGHSATIMVIGTLLLTATLMVFAMPGHSGVLAVTLMVILGVAFSLLPAALWPAVPKIVPERLLGTSYSVIYYIQNIGLMVVPMLIGRILQSDTVGDQVDYTRAMWIFTAIGVAGIMISVLLLVADRRKHYGLEQPNVKV